MDEVHVEMTEEIKEKLKAAGQLGFQVDAVFTYVPKFYRDKKNNIPKSLWPIFKLKSKNGIEVAEAEDGIGYVNLDSIERKYVIEAGKQRIETLEKGIVSVKNFICEDGSVVNCAGSKTLIKILPAAMQVELQNAINERSLLTPEELLGLE